MRTINILIIIAYSISTVFISISLLCILFNIPFKPVFDVIGYSALMLGGSLTLIKVFLTKRAGRK